jgi:CheY-like chemotaxis protein
MSENATKKVHVPLSQHTVGELRAKAAELRDMAARGRIAADREALATLSRRLDALAQRRESEELEALRAAEALAMRLTERECLEGEHLAATDISHREMGMPSPEALRMATDAICRHYVLPETPRHPMVRSACVRLAYQLMAYGAASTTAPEVATPPARRLHDLPASLDTTPQVLIVDDVADVLVTVGAYLVKTGFAVRKASNGDEALRLIASDNRIGILVTDFAMPGMSGTDLIAQATQIRPDLKTIVITGYPNADGLAELPSHTTLLVKPFRRDALMAAIGSLLGEASTKTVELIEPG